MIRTFYDSTFRFFFFFYILWFENIFCLLFIFIWKFMCDMSTLKKKKKNDATCRRIFKIFNFWKLSTKNVINLFEIYFDFFFFFFCKCQKKCQPFSFFRFLDFLKTYMQHFVNIIICNTFCIFCCWFVDFLRFFDFLKKKRFDMTLSNHFQKHHIFRYKISWYRQGTTHILYLEYIKIK